MNRGWSVVFLFQVLTAGCLALFLTTLPAAANSKYAAMVVDGHTGKMIYGENMDAPRYPASITKVMTLYIVFEELRAGRLSKSTKFKVSKYASRQAPSRLGLKPGAKITVDHAIRALVTKSANDVAMVVAEGVSGSQKKFAQRMTKTARRMGMSKTTFRNPHGLPDKRQKTTARDLIKLSMQIQSDFPKLYSYFSVKSFKYRGRTYRNHNKLLGRYKGTTGIKTGYIRASGFNLTAVVQRGDKKIVAVVLGGKTGRSRDAHMRKIISRAFPKAIAYKGPSPTTAPAPGRKPGFAVATANSVSSANTVAEAALGRNLPEKPRVLESVIPVSGKTDEISVASRREGVLVMRLAALAPRNREIPLAEPVSRYTPAKGIRAVRAATTHRNSIHGPQITGARAPGTSSASGTLGAVPATAYASVQDTSVLLSIADLITNTAATVNSQAPQPIIRKARLILPPSSTVEPVAATPVQAIRSAVPGRDPIVKSLGQTQLIQPAAGRKPTVQTAPAPSRTKAPVLQITLPEGYQIQVGAYVRKANAEERIDEVRKAAHRLLSEAMGIAVPAENDKGTFYRARFAGLAKRQANRTCKALKKRRIACIVLAQ